MKRSASLAVAIAATWILVLGSGTPASATATPRISVEQGGSTVSSGATVMDDVIVNVSASTSSTFTIGTADLMMRLGTSGAYTCMKRWSVNASTFSGSFTWDTTQWPEAPSQSGCTGRTSPALTRNGQYQVSLVVTDNDVSNCGVATCSYRTSFTMKVANPPSIPAWVSDPEASGTQDRSPIVQIQFSGSPEPDIVEYHWIREGPDGEAEYAVSATNPGGQGCDFDGSIYTCYDDTFPTAFAGQYNYALIAFRASPTGNGRCALPPEGTCIESPMSSPRSVSMAEPPPSPSGTPTKGGSSPTASPSRRSATRVEGGIVRRGGSGGSNDYQDFFTGSYDEKLPYGQQPGFGTPGGLPGQTSTETLASGAVDESTTEQNRRVWTSIAGGLALLLAAAHLSRMLRRT
jgi:hypothetical protein